MGTEFIVSSEYEGYVYVGNARGNIRDEETGEKRAYHPVSYTHLTLPTIA